MTATQPADATSDVQQLARLAQAVSALRSQVAQRIVGQDEVVSGVLTALLANGHSLLIGVPGLAKTLLVSTIAEALELSFNRVQFTPDLMPGDITGTELVEEDPATGRRSFRFLPGPVFANVLLADEINRTPPKTQAALLQAMQEHQVTAAGKTYPLPDPFFVLATQNPIEQEGTYPLPEAQRDRFLFKLVLRYPDEAAEREMVRRWGKVTSQPKLSALSSAGELLALREEVDRVHVADAVEAYLLRLVRATRDLVPAPAQLRGTGLKQRNQAAKNMLAYGGSPRASLCLYQAGKALAWLRGADHVTPDHIQELFPDVMRHRVGLTYEAEAEGVGEDEILRGVLDRTPVPSATELARG
jgi:MoxR-like ATPase